MLKGLSETIALFLALSELSSGKSFTDLWLILKIPIFTIVTIPRKRSNMLKKIVLLFALSPMSIFAQQGFVELRKEISCFDNTRCVNQEFHVSIPYFDVLPGKSVFRQINDSIYRISEVVLKDINAEITYPIRSWEEDKKGIEGCADGISSTESRELYYSVVFNENNILSVIVRNDWMVEKQSILEGRSETAEQQLVYCFSVDVEKDILLDVNTLFPAEKRNSIIEMIRSEYENTYEEDMLKAGDRLQFCGMLFTHIELLAVYVRLLPNNQSEVRTVELPLSETHDLMNAAYQQKFKHDE